MVDPKRISGRFEFRIEFSGIVQRYGKEVSFRGWSRDLSESGMGAYAPVELREGELVNLDLSTQAAGGGQSAPRAGIRVWIRICYVERHATGGDYLRGCALRRCALSVRARAKPSQLFWKALLPRDMSAEQLRCALVVVCL
jgi:hypothetical protein